MIGEQNIRLAAFLGVLVTVSVWELLAPKRKLSDSKVRHWTANLSMVAINTVAVRLIVPVLPAGTRRFFLRPIAMKPLSEA